MKPRNRILCQDLIILPNSGHVYLEETFDAPVISPLLPGVYLGDLRVKKWTYLGEDDEPTDPIDFPD